MKAMRAVTIKEAKAKLNELVELAASGEEVVLMRGSKHVVALIPLTEDDLELAPRLTDEQAARIWRELARSGARGRSSVFDSPEQAAAHLEPRGQRNVRGPSSRT